MFSIISRKPGSGAKGTAMTVLNRTDPVASEHVTELAAAITSSPTGYAGVEGDERWAAEIRRLAELRNATILAHNYQLPAIQDVADHVGDSLALSRIAAEAPEETIVFCGVHFMAETAKILSPEKTVLIPDQRAGCSLADSITPEDLQGWKDEHPDAVVVSYVNTTGGQGAHRHLLHIVECRRRRCLHRRGPRGAVLPRPVPRGACAPGDGQGKRARMGRRVPRARRDQRRRAHRAGPRASGRRTIRPPGVRLRHVGAVSGRRRGLPAGAGEDLVDRRHAGRRAGHPGPPGAGRHGDRDAASAAQCRARRRLPRGQ